MSLEPTTSDCRSGISRIVFEALLVAAIGVVLALAANGLSPHGLNLTRDYFQTGSGVPLPAPPDAGASSNAAVPDLSAATAAPPTLIVVPRLAEKGLQGIDVAQATRFFQDPRRLQNRIVFVDARSELNYEQGHIPGAHQLNPYEPDETLKTLLPLCQAAELVVVYCTGIDCEDSEVGALVLRNAGVPNQKLFVFAGGITEWTASQLPVETGLRQGAEPGTSNQ